VDKELVRMDKPKDGAYLMYVKDGKMYPVALDESEHTMLQILAKSFEPLKLAPYPQDAATIEELRKQGKVK
jgi:hypothetical protein